MNLLKEYGKIFDPDNWITGKGDTTNPASPYYDGIDLSGAIYCPVCRKYFKDGWQLEELDTIGLLADEELCEDCAYYEITQQVDNYNLED